MPTEKLRKEPSCGHFQTHKCYLATPDVVRGSTSVAACGNTTMGKMQDLGPYFDVQNENLYFNEITR